MSKPSSKERILLSSEDGVPSSKGICDSEVLRKECFNPLHGSCASSIVRSSHGSTLGCDRKSGKSQEAVEATKEDEDVIEAMISI